jgi:hypothetical protein
MLIIGIRYLERNYIEIKYLEVFSYFKILLSKKFQKDFTISIYVNEMDKEI